MLRKLLTYLEEEVILFGEHFLHEKPVKFDAFRALNWLGVTFEHLRWELHWHLLQGSAL